MHVRSLIREDSSRSRRVIEHQHQHIGKMWVVEWRGSGYIFYTTVRFMSLEFRRIILFNNARESVSRRNARILYLCRYEWSIVIRIPAHIAHNPHFIRTWLKLEVSDETGERNGKNAYSEESQSCVVRRRRWQCALYPFCFFLLNDNYFTISYNPFYYLFGAHTHAKCTRGLIREFCWIVSVPHFRYIPSYI